VTLDIKQVCIRYEASRKLSNAQTDLKSSKLEKAFSKLKEILSLPWEAFKGFNH
jgi:hypothetical protein